MSSKKICVRSVSMYTDIRAKHSCQYQGPRKIDKYGEGGTYSYIRVVHH